jgi:hypothetical protein
MKQFSGIVSMQFNILSDKAYASRVAYFENQDRAIDAEEKWTEYVYNAMLRAINHADPSHLAKVLNAARLWQKYRAVARIFKKMGLPWNWSAIETPQADVPKANKKRLAYLRANWERDFIQCLDEEDSHQQERPFTLEAFETAILHLVKKAQDKGLASNKIKAIMDKVEEERLVA